MKWFVWMCCVVMLLLVSCQPSREDVGMTTVKQYVDIPASAQNVEAYFTGEFHYRAAVVKFDVFAGTLKDFLLKTCFNSLDNLSSNDNPFKGGGSNIPLPGWWKGSGDELAVGGVCQSNSSNIAYEMSVGHNNNVFTVYLRLTIP